MIPTYSISALLNFIPKLEKFRAQPLDKSVRSNDEPFNYRAPQPVADFHEALYSNGFVTQFDWTTWQQEADAFLRDPDSLKLADLETVKRLLTTIARREHLGDGYLEMMIREGKVGAILHRLSELEPQAPVDISIRHVSEHDIDLLLLDEFACSEEFLRWFFELVHKKVKSLKLLAVKHSSLSSFGEADLELELLVDGAQRVNVYIEDKIDATFQPRQLERYLERGCATVEADTCSDAAVVLVAPKAYHGDAPLPSKELHSGLKVNARLVSYEDIREWFACHSASSPRYAFKAKFLTCALEKSRNLTGSDAVTSFWRNYSTYVHESALPLIVNAADLRPGGSIFINFECALPRGVQLIHKTTYGHVDLQFAGLGTRVDDLQTLVSPLLSSKRMRVARAAKSAVIRCNVPPVYVEKSFESQGREITESVEAAKELYQWWLAHSAKIMPQLTAMKEKSATDGTFSGF